MIGATLAIGDFMLMLLTAIASAVLGIAGWALLGLVVAGGAVLAIRRMIRPRS